MSSGREAQGSHFTWIQMEPVVLAADVIHGHGRFPKRHGEARRSTGIVQNEAGEPPADEAHGHRFSLPGRDPLVCAARQNEDRRKSAVRIHLRNRFQRIDRQLTAFPSSSLRVQFIQVHCLDMDHNSPPKGCRVNNLSGCLVHVNSNIMNRL